MLLEGRRSRTGSSTATHEFRWGQTAQRTVRAIVVVIFSPCSAARSGMTEVLKLRYPWQLVTEPAGEAFREAILSRTTGLNVKRSHIEFQHPRWKRLRDELGAVVAPNLLRGSIHHKQLGHPIDQVLSANALRDIQTDTTAGVFIDDRQPFQRLTMNRSIKDEIPTPDVVRPGGSANVASMAAVAQGSLFPRSFRHFQPLA